jgi:hypothetical protein
MLLASSLFATPVKETVWWDTPGGKVTENRDQTDASCSLMLYDHDGSVTFEWDSLGRTFVIAINWDWQFPDNWKMPIAIQLGDAWLSNQVDSVVVDAVGHGSTLTFATDSAVDDLLRPADHITVRTTKAEMTIRLKRDKIGVLLSQTRKCRDMIGR